MSLALLEPSVCVWWGGDCYTLEFMQHTLHDFRKIVYSLEVQKTLLLQIGHRDLWCLLVNWILKTLVLASGVPCQ